MRWVVFNALIAGFSAPDLAFGWLAFLDDPVSAPVRMTAHDTHL